MDKSIAIKEMTSFLYSDGDLTSELFLNKRQTEGTKIHQELQSKYNEQSKKEVYVKYNYLYFGDNILIHGFIDGVLKIDNELILEEIKSTTKSFDEAEEYFKKMHLAQLKVYAYIYCKNEDLNEIKTRLTYYNVKTKETKYVYNTFDISELEIFFFETITKYLEWLGEIDKKDALKLDSINKLKFPFETIRPGQREMMKAIFYSHSNHDISYICAPTGIGKTMAALFSSLKTVKELHEKIFYLTAKNTGKLVALKAVDTLMDNGLKIKTLILTAKQKCCLLKTKRCEPNDCIYAKGFFERLTKATMEIFEQTDLYDFKTIEKYAIKHQICSFEFSLYLSYFCDLVIADYNYAFDPKAHLIRYFDDDTYKIKLLIDEAHNLVKRSKDMFSSSFYLSDVVILKELTLDLEPSTTLDLDMLIEYLYTYKDKVTENTMHMDFMYDKEIFLKIKILLSKLEELFTTNEQFDNRFEALEIFFKLKDYISICEIYDKAHRFLVFQRDGQIEFSLLCLDASRFLFEILNNRTDGAAFFSATLTPIKYHMDLLSAGHGKHLILESPFNRENLNLIINDSISTTYKNREYSINQVVEIIKIMVSSKIGNYIVFFPSYKYLNMVHDNLVLEDIDLIVQKPNMSNFEQEEYFNLFKDSSKTQLGLFVMGGVFSEGLDYIGDLLSGVCIVGVGLPMINYENDLAKSYFEELEVNGFDYAYTIPGFIKVVQAAGRVIRSETDKGIVILIDERFRYKVYQNMMPKFWDHRKTITNNEVLKNELKRFWDK